MKELTLDTLLLDGGCLCFDLVNTISHRKRPGAHDYIGSYTELLQWVHKTRGLPDEQLNLLKKLAAEQSGETASALTFFREVRELLYRFFSAVAARRFPGEKTCDLTNEYIRQAMRRLEFNAARFPVTLEQREAGSDLREPVWAGLRSAWDVLNSQDQTRIKECEACGWLFLDRTRNKGKRWCNPATCGNTDKTKRYYRRKKATG